MRRLRRLRRRVDQMSKGDFIVPDTGDERVDIDPRSMTKLDVTLPDIIRLIIIVSNEKLVHHGIFVLLGKNRVNQVIIPSIQKPVNSDIILPLYGHPLADESKLVLKLKIVAKFCHRGQLLRSKQDALQCLDKSVRNCTKDDLS